MPIWKDTGINLENVVQLLGGQLSRHPLWLNPPHHILVHPHQPFQDDGDGLLVTRLKVHLLQQAFSDVPQALRCVQEVLRRL